MVEIIDVSHNKETGELEQFTVIDEGGQPQLITGSRENILLYDPENKLPFDDGLRGFFESNEAIVLSDSNPELILAPTVDMYRYIILYNGSTVETTPQQTESVLEALYDALTNGDISGVLSVYDDIMSSQVRREVINALLSTFDQDDRIDIHDRGWLIDNLYLVDWSASMYVKHDDPNEPDKIRTGSGIEVVDQSYEFMQLSSIVPIQPVNIILSGNEYRMTEREVWFLAKVKWLLHRRQYHPDKPFWYYVDRYSSVDELTGLPPEESDTPSVDTFDI